MRTRGLDDTRRRRLAASGLRVLLFPRPCVPASFRRAFTLVELLLVIAIVAIVSAVTMPTFVQSLRGNRLRMATKTVVMAGRYARSMAVMSQQEYALRLDLDEARITVGPAQRRAPVPRNDADMGPDAPLFSPESPEPGAAAPAAPAAAGELARELDRVRIASVEVEAEEQAPADSGKVTVYYRTSGRCLPYTVKLVDEDGKTATVDVDALASAETRE